MKFVLTDDYTYWWPVTVSVPDPDNAGQVVEQKFEMQFRAMTDEDAREHDEGGRKLKTAGEMQRHQSALLERVCLDWDDDVVGIDGKPMPFTGEALRQALGFSWFRIGVYLAYAQSLAGEGARKGN